MVDTPVAFAETAHMLSYARETGSPVRQLVLTHNHFDHSAGSQMLPDIDRIAQFGAGKLMQSAHAIAYLALEPPEHPDLKHVVITPPTLEVQGPATIYLKRRTLQLLPTPGHSPDSMSVLLEQEGILFAGDAVITCFPPVIQDGDSRQAVNSWRRILDLEFDWLVPGHGPILDAPAARRYCEVCIRYIEAVWDSVSRLAGREITLARAIAAAQDTWLMLPANLENAAAWHHKVIGKILDEWKKNSSEPRKSKRDDSLRES